MQGYGKRLAIGVALLAAAPAAQAQRAPNVGPGTPWGQTGIQLHRLGRLRIGLRHPARRRRRHGLRDGDDQQGHEPRRLHHFKDMARSAITLNCGNDAQREIGLRDINFAPMLAAAKNRSRLYYIERDPVNIGGPTNFNPPIFNSVAAGTLGAANQVHVVVTNDGDAALAVSDPDTVNPGHLINGTFVLPQALTARATSVNQTNPAYAAVSGAPLTLLSWPGPTTTEPVQLGFRQAIGAADILRAGSYAKALTFTLSTTTP